MRPIFHFIWLVIFLLAGFYITLHLLSIRKYPVEYGISFSKSHSNYLGLDWRANYLAMLDDLKPKYVRVLANWNEIEVQKDMYYMDEIDWQVSEAEKRGVKLVIVLGQKAPRWPECHVPDWSISLNLEEYQKKLFDYIEYIVNRYKDNPALEIWQVENEPFIRFTFGECKNFKLELVPEEIKLVKKLDSKHKIMITDSGELSTWRLSSKYGDILGSTLYRVVRMPGGKIFDYDWLPASFYRLKARFWGKNQDNFYISELQAEPWFTNGTPLDTDISIQEETMNLERLEKNLDYSKRVGASRSYIWGVEWWYWLKEKQNKKEYWDTIKQKIGNNQ